MAVSSLFQLPLQAGFSRFGSATFEHKAAATQLTREQRSLAAKVARGPWAIAGFAPWVNYAAKEGASMETESDKKLARDDLFGSTATPLGRAWRDLSLRERARIARRFLETFQNDIRAAAEAVEVGRAQR
jgi:hypothetical protein